MKQNNFIFLVTLVVNFFKVIISDNHVYNSTVISPFLRFTMSTDLLFVGGEGGIVALNKNNLTEIDSSVKFGSNWLLLYNRHNNTLIQCSELNDTSHCQKLDTTLSSLANDTVLSIEKITNSPVYVLTTVLEANADVIVIGSTLVRVGMKHYAIVTLNATSLTIFDNEDINGPMNLEIGPSYDIVFKSIISSDNFIFVFFQLFNHSSNITRKSVIGKLCKKTRGAAKHHGYYHFYEDIGLKCKIGNTTLEIVERAVVVNNESVVVIFTNGSKQAVCTFSLKSIIKRMTSERKVQLKCNFKKAGSYFKPNLTVNDAQCFNDSSCTNDNSFCSAANGSFCNTTLYSTLWNGTTFETVNYLNSVSSSHQLTTVAVLPLQNNTDFIMFFGTADGFIIMVRAKTKEEKIEKLEERKVKVTSSSIIDILIEGQIGIFVLSRNQVIKKLLMTNCSHYESCYSCHNTLNHECSWNVFNESCEVYKNISGMILPSEKCFGFHGNKRRLIQTVEVLGIHFSKPPSMSGVLICSFDQASNFSWMTNNTTSACIPENDTNLSRGNYTLTLKFNGATVARIELDLIMCWNLNSSKECLDYHCGWSCSSEQCARLDYDVQKPVMFDFHPKHSIISGGRLISIFGPNVGFYGCDRYKIYFYNETSPFVECRNVTAINNTVINCISGNISTPMVLNRLKMVIDNSTILQINQSLTYVKDPTGFELSNETASVQQSGGAKITISGEGFYNIGQVTIDRVAKRCVVGSDIWVECETPKYSGSSDLTDKVSETVNVYFDGLAVPITIDYVKDPMFEKYKDIVEFEKGAAIEIKGRNILVGARFNDYTIYIGKTGLCYTEKKYVTDTYIKCWPPQYVPLTNYTDQSLVYVHVKVGRLLEHIGVLKYVKETNHLVVVISVLVAALVIAICVGVAATLRMRNKRKKDEKKFVFELQSVEERVRTNSREEFAETQIAIGDIQSDLVASKVPYRDYQTYILLQLFPNQDPSTNSLLLHLQVTNDSDTKYKEAMEKLELLLQNKLFLKSIVQTLDKPNTLTVQEKAQFAALLSIALLGNMRLFYDLVHCLLTDSIRSVTKRLQRGLFRRLDSITCRMMTNWLQIVLFKQLRGQYGIQLFMLVKAVQTVIERGPVDAVTGHCKNTLCEEKLLKLRVDSEQYILNIDLNGNPDHCFQVKVLKCDTISQVKRKCCSQIYKNKPASEIPKFEELILEWKEGHAGTLLLQDVDQTSERTDVHVRLNTLSHYKVGNDCRMALLYGIQKDDNNVNLTGQNDSVSFEDVNPLMPYDSERDEYLQKSHLSTSHVEEGPNLERDIGDIYLNRLFHTKLLLSKYIDSVFEGLLDSKCVSLPISYFIQNLDELGRKNAVDPEVLQIWKNECYATRIWAPLIGKPQAAFDIHVPGHIEPIMDVLSQVFVECLTQKTFRVNKKSPTQRLLFHKDIERYRKFIPAFYDNLEPVAGHDFWKTLDELSDMQQEDVKFSRHSTIHQLYNLFIAKYKNKILNDFEDMEESSGLQFGQKLEEIFELMEK